MNNAGMSRRGFGLSAVGAVAAAAATGIGAGAANAQSSSASLTPSLAQQYGVPLSGPVVFDSRLSFEQAYGTSSDPQRAKDLALMKPHMALVNVLYRGFDNALHFGQIVVNKAIENETKILFVKMFQLGFPIKSVIPQSQFGYDDETSMQANNTSNFRPDRLGSGNLSEHFKGASFDINTFVNPFDVLNDDGSRTIQPAGASYDPRAKGAIVKDSDLRRMWSARDYEWGGNWGDPQADPPIDFYQIGYFDYQHMQFNQKKMDTVKLSLPEGLA